MQYLCESLLSVLWRCWFGDRKGIRDVTTEWWGTDVVICLERGANDLHMVQLMPLPPHHLLLQYNPEQFTFLVLAYPGYPGKRPLNGCSSSLVSVCESQFPRNAQCGALVHSRVWGSTNFQQRIYCTHLVVMQQNLAWLGVWRDSGQWTLVPQILWIFAGVLHYCIIPYLSSHCPDDYVGASFLCKSRASPSSSLQ